MIFSRSGLSKAPRRAAKFSWQRRGAFFCACFLSGAALLWISSRAISRFAIFPDYSAISPPFATDSKREMEAKRNRSLGAALAKIDAQTARAWINRWTSSDQSGIPNAPKLVRIDAERLARQHPAWLLADALERGIVSPSNPQIAREIEMAMRDNGSSLGNLGVSNLINATRAVPARAVRKNSAVSGATARQNAALENFFRSAAARDELRGRDDAWLSRRALEDAIAAARRGAVPELDLALMSPETALELTNLRLQLLRNLSKTPAERAATRQEIRAIEARYAQILRDETERQSAKLRAARIEIPLQERRAGLREIEAELERQTRSRAEIRRNLARESQIRVRRDFADNSALQLNLPPARVISPADFRAISASERRVTRDGTQFFETPSQKASSFAPIPSGQVLKSAQLKTLKSPAQTIANLRQQARSQTQQWARLAAGNLGATWTQNSSAPDATEVAAQILFPTSKRF